MNHEKTAFYWHEKCFWHFGGNYAQLAPVKGLVQPMVSGGLPEAPETKRRLKNLVEVSGLASDLEMRTTVGVSYADLLRVHTKAYLDKFKAMSDKDGGEIGLRTPFGPGAFEIACLSAGLVKSAVESVMKNESKNAYALSRPPGHHCLPDWPNGFCLVNNIAVAVEAAKASGLVERVAIVDWDVHHGNGTEQIFYDRSDVLTISVHQNLCYPSNTGYIEDIGEGSGQHANMNIPLQPGAGHDAYLEVMERLIVPKLKSFKADLIVVACGFDASGVDPLARMLCTSDTFRQMTAQLMNISEGRLVAAHEGGYSEVHVPFCGHAMLEQMSGSSIHAEDPLLERLNKTQPDKYTLAYQSNRITQMVDFFNLKR